MLGCDFHIANDVISGVGTPALSGFRGLPRISLAQITPNVLERTRLAKYIIHTPSQEQSGKNILFWRKRTAGATVWYYPDIVWEINHGLIIHNIIMY
jgi:hypothetical protein